MEDCIDESMSMYSNDDQTRGLDDKQEINKRGFLQKEISKCFSEPFLVLGIYACWTFCSENKLDKEFVDKTLMDNAIISREHISVHRYYKTNPLLVINWIVKTYLDMSWERDSLRTITADGEKKSRMYDSFCFGNMNQTSSETYAYRRFLWKSMLRLPYSSSVLFKNDWGWEWLWIKNQMHYSCTTAKNCLYLKRLFEKRKDKCNIE